MDAAQYFELSDAIACAADRDDLALITQRIARTEMHSLERRVLERAARARGESLLLGRAASAGAERAVGLHGTGPGGARG